MTWVAVSLAWWFVGTVGVLLAFSLAVDEPARPKDIGLALIAGLFGPLGAFAGFRSWRKMQRSAQQRTESQS